jgi:hypothetical protein
MYSDFISTFDPTRVGQELRLHEKVKLMLASPRGGNTDFISAHELILQKCVENKISDSDMPSKIFILSDMQFDNFYKNCTKSSINFKNKPYSINVHSQQTIHESLSSAYYSAGMNSIGSPYKLPQQIYWCLRSDTTGFPVQTDTPNTQMISGFSSSLLRLFLLEENVPSEHEPPSPWDTFQKAINNEHYRFIKELLDDSDEGCLAQYNYIPRHIE